MDAAFVTAKEATTQGVPRATAYRAVQTFRDALADRVLVVDGEPVVDPDALATLLASLANRADSLQQALAASEQQRQRLEADVQIARHELELERGQTAATAPILADIVAKASQLLARNLTPPGSELGPSR